MLPTATRAHCCWTLLALGVALGCGSEAPPLPVPQSTDADEPHAAPVENRPATLTEAPPAEVDPEAPAADSPVAAEATTAYKPPYPDRIDLFAAPERKGDSSKDQDETVELVGFAKRDETKALLSFNGEVSPVGEGGERNGVQVISIQPPKVVLQRGRQRWQASIEN